MGKEEVLKILKRNGKWMTVKEITDCNIGSTETNISKYAKKMSEEGLIIRKEVAKCGKHSRYKYRCKKMKEGMEEKKDGN